MLIGRLGCSKLLLDAQAEPEITQAIREKIEGGGEAVLTDLHVWHIGPGIYSVIMVIDASSPKPVEFYKQQLDAERFPHITVELVVKNHD